MSCCSGCTGCKVLKGIVALLLTVTSIGGLLGVWMTHFAGGLMFGTPEGSLAIVAFVVSISMWLKIVKSMCPCNKGDCCGPAGK